MTYRRELSNVLNDAFVRATGRSDAAMTLQTTSRLGILTRSSMDDKRLKQAGQLIANGYLPIADCFAVALASRVRGVVATADHRAFDPMAAQRIRKIMVQPD